MRLVPASQLHMTKCTTGCSILDTLLQGGFPCGSLTEVVGAGLVSCTSSSAQRQDRAR